MISKGAVSKAVESLIRKSLLERLPDREDRRKIHLRLREQAKPLMEAVDQVREEFLAAVLKGFSSRDLATLVELQRRCLKIPGMPWKEGEVIPNETERTGTDKHGASEISGEQQGISAEGASGGNYWLSWLCPRWRRS